MVSDMQPTMQADLVRADGAPVQAGSLTLVSKPHVYYNSGCRFRAALPPGGPPPMCVSEQSDQYVASVSIPAPEDYARRWTEYRVSYGSGTAGWGWPRRRPRRIERTPGACRVRVDAAGAQPGVADCGEALND